jgi:hypothetical protein
MPDRALYYPTTTISDPTYLFDALLYWDTISCIIPSEGYRDKLHYDDPEMEVAMKTATDRFTQRLVPSNLQKQAAHHLLKEALLQPIPHEISNGLTAIIYTGKLDPLTLELLQIGGWLKDAGKHAWEIERYIEKRKNGDTESCPPGYSLQLPLGLANLLMAALAASCSSEYMPPVTSDYYGFTESINGLLGHAGLAQGCELGLEYVGKPQSIDSFHPRLAESPRSKDLRCLFATIPRLGFESSVSAQMLMNLLEARGKDEVQVRQRDFRKVVDTYLVQLRDADDSERAIIIQEFRANAVRDLNLLNGELKRLSLGTLVLKEGLVGMAAGAAAGSAPVMTLPISAAIGSILGLSHGLLKYREQRDKILGSHWSSWAVSAENSRFSLW